MCGQVHVRNPLPQSIRLRLGVLVRTRGRLGRVEFILDILRWNKKTSAHITPKRPLPGDSAPLCAITQQQLKAEMESTVGKGETDTVSTSSPSRQKKKIQKTGPRENHPRQRGLTRIDVSLLIPNCGWDIDLVKGARYTLVSDKSGKGQRWEVRRRNQKSPL